MKFFFFAMFLLPLFAIAQMEHSMMDHSAHAAPKPAPLDFEGETNRDMAKMMSDMHAPGYTGNYDIDFLAMMIPHHQGAIDMARLVLKFGHDPLTRSVAEDIIAGQQVEIAAMKARLELLRSGADEGAARDSEYPTLSGTRGMAQ